MSMPETAVITRYFEADARRDIDAIVALFTDDAAVLATAIRLVAVHITPQHRDAARRVLARAAAPPPQSPAPAEEG